MVSLEHLPEKKVRGRCILNPPYLWWFDQLYAFLSPDHTRTQNLAMRKTDSSRHFQRWVCAYGIVLQAYV